MGEAKRRAPKGATLAKATTANTETVMAMPVPEKNEVTVGQLLMAYGVVGWDPTRKSAIRQIEGCEIDAARSAEWMCCLDEVQAKTVRASEAWNKAPEQERVTKVFGSKITLQFQPFNLAGLFKSGGISGEALRLLEPWLIRRDKPALAVDNGNAPTDAADGE